MKTIKSVLIGAFVALLGSSAWAKIEADKNPVPKVGIGDAGAVTITLTSTETSDRSLSFSSSSAAATHWQNNYISVDLSSSTISRSGGTITATIKGLKETGNAQTFSIYRANRTDKYLDITVTKVEKGTEEIDCGDVFISHGQTQILTNDQGQAILLSKVKESSSSNEDIATLTSSNVNNVAYAAVNNPVRDGTAKLVVAIEGTNYNYTVHAMTVEIEKTVKAAYETDKNNRSNATIRVTTHVLYGVHEIPTNTILFIGSTCTSHGLGGEIKTGHGKDDNNTKTDARDNTAQQINTIAQKGKVKWFIYNNGQNAQSTTTAAASGTVEMEQTVKTGTSKATGVVSTDLCGGSKHRNLLAYLTCLDNELKDDHSGVDYIVLSFDGGRLAKQYRDITKDYSALEAQVAKKLEWYYKNNRVIWIREAYPVTWDADPNEQYGKEYYRPANTMDDEVMNQKQWEAMVAMLDPVTYNSKPSGSRYTETKTGTGSGDAKGKTIYAATRNDIQTDYNSPDKVKAFLDEHIKKATYDTELVDKVLNLNNSLSIVKTGTGTKQEVHFYTWAGKSAPVAPAGGVIADLPKNDDNWKAEPDSAFKVDGYQVTANVSNITMETWNMFEISIVDNGTFLQECIKAGKAEYDEKTGKWMVDPNDGSAHVTLYSMEGGQKYEVQAAAKATSVLWPFDLIPLKIYVDDATVTYGDDVPTTLGWKSGAARYDLPNVDASKISGLDTVTFGTTYTKGSSVGSNYSINTNSAALSSTYYAITVVPGKLTVKPATIKPVKPGEEPTDPTKPYTAAPCIEKTYDGEGTNITAEVFNVDDTTDVPTFLYSLNEDGPFWSWDQITIRDVELDDADEVTSNKVWYTVTTKTAGGDENYFAATNFAWILIKPRPVTLTAASESWLYDGNEHKTNGWEVTSGSFVPGEGVDTTHFSMTDESVITDVGEVVNAIDADKLQPLSETDLDNYDITLDTGWLRVSGIDITATAEDVEITYDGTKTNITVKIGESYEPHGDFKIWYAYDKIEHIDDEKRTFSMVRPSDAPEDSAFTMDESPKFMDAGTNRVWFKVVDQNENYSNYYGSARIRILPRPVHFTFPKAVKPYDGTTTGVPLATNLIGAADNMVGAEWFDCTATGTFTSPNVGDDEDYFHLDNVTVDGKKNAFKRNYVITYDGEDTGLVPGAITVLPIDPVEPGSPDDNPDDEPDPTDGPTIWARNVVKVYDGIGTNVIAQVYNAVPGNTFTYEYSTNEVDFVAWDALQFTNVVAEQKVWYRAMTAQGNYLGVTNFAFVTITAAPIQAVPEGEYPDDPTKPWAQATSVEVWTNDCPSVLDGTNITVDVEQFYGNDKPTLEYSCDLVSWKTDAEMKSILNHILATQVWCRVSCEPNYISTNVTAYVYIKSRESKPDDEEAEKEDKLQPNPDPTKPTTEDQTEKVVENIAANDNRLPPGTGPGKYDSSKPFWDGEGTESGGSHGVQTDAKVNLKVTSVTNLPDDEEEKAEEHRTNEVAKAAKELGVDPDSVKGRSVDVKLLYTRTYSDGTQSDPINIGGNNTEIIPFTIAVELEEDEQILKIVRYHGEARSEISAGTNPTLEHFELSADRKYVTVYAKTYSEFIIIVGDIPVAVGDDTVETYDYKATIKHTYIRIRRTGTAFGAALPGGIQNVYVKYTKSSSLEGYVIQTVGGCLRGRAAAITGALDLQDRNRCFLVVKNKSAERACRFPRIIPGVLEAKWYEDKLVTSATKPAQGVLYLGGEATSALRGTAFTANDGTPAGYTPRAFAGQWQRLVPVATTPTIGIDDYWFTSCYLFGQYNQPSWENIGGVSTIEEFGDAWLNHAGIGKARYANNIAACCGRGTGVDGTVLDSLSGNLKAGFYLCSENGENESHTLGVSRTGLAEDQVWIGVNENDPAGTAVYAAGTRPNPAMKVLDIWADGNLDLRTTDVGYGTWAIKRTTRLLPSSLDAADRARLATWGATTPNVTLRLLMTIKGAMLHLDSSATLFGDPVNGNELINCSFFRGYLAE